jgi:hypothetical protein
MLTQALIPDPTYKKCNRGAGFEKNGSAGGLGGYFRILSTSTSVHKVHKLLECRLLTGLLF